MTVARTGVRAWWRPLVIACSCAGAMLLFTGAAAALKPSYDGQKAFVTAHLGAKAKLSLVTVRLTAAQRDTIARQWGLPTVDDSVAYIVSRGSNNELRGAVVFVHRLLERYNEEHSIGVALDSAGNVSGVALIGPHGEYAGKLGVAAFMQQFRRAYAAGKAPPLPEVNAVSGATYSSRTVQEMVSMAVAIYRQFVLKQSAQ